MSKRVFKLRCDGIGRVHTKFTLFDPDHANCGTIVISTRDLMDLVYHSWSGRVDWNKENPFREEKAAGRDDTPMPADANDNPEQESPYDRPSY